MGWSLGYDAMWDRDIGYGVPATCDHPGCGKPINRGLAYVCAEQEPHGGPNGCGLFFCSDHSDYQGRCEHCAAEDGDLFAPTPDVPEWINHKLTDDSWKGWRDENPDEVAKLRATSKASVSP